ncbi:MAG TPA: hypothetical protein ENI15_15980 [Spirochaetes bacterium]|nr:hypothetical protein [Spirochaetota bacterium]
MKKIILTALLLVSATLISCSIEPPPNVSSITANVGLQQITIVLEANNYVTPQSKVKSKITLTRGSFTGTVINFEFVGFSTPASTYTLDSFEPAIQSGQTYYFAFEQGAFGNYGEWYSPSETRGESDPGVYMLEL